MIVINENNIKIKYLDVKQTSDIDILIQKYFARLKKVYQKCQDIQVKIANTSRYDAEIKTQSSYWVNINLKLAENSEIEVFRQPKSNYDIEPVSFAITESFAILYRKLIEYQLKNRN